MNYTEFLEMLGKAAEFYAQSPDGQYDGFVSRLCEAVLEEAKLEDVESEPCIVTLMMRVRGDI